MPDAIFGDVGTINGQRVARSGCQVNYMLRSQAGQILPVAWVSWSSPCGLSCGVHISGECGAPSGLDSDVPESSADDAALAIQCRSGTEMIHSSVE